jgi:hypothetical protein
VRCITPEIAPPIQGKILKLNGFYLIWKCDSESLSRYQNPSSRVWGKAPALPPSRDRSINYTLDAFSGVASVSPTIGPGKNHDFIQRARLRCRISVGSAIRMATTFAAMIIAAAIRK